MCEDRVDEAFQHLSEAIALFADLGCIGLSCGARLNLGLLYESDGQFEEAQAAYEEDLALARSTEARRAEAAALTHLGALLLRRGDVSPARPLLDAAVRIAGSTESAPLQGEAGTVFAELLALEGATEEADLVISEAIEKMRGVAPHDLGVAVARRGRIEIWGGHLARAALTLTEVEALAVECRAGGRSPLGMEIARLRDALRSALDVGE